MTGGEILGYFKNGVFRGFGGGAPDCRRLSRVQEPQAPAGIKRSEEKKEIPEGLEPLRSLEGVKLDLVTYSPPVKKVNANCSCALINTRANYTAR